MSDKKKIKKLKKELERQKLLASKYYFDLKKAFKELPKGEVKKELEAKYDSFKFVSLDMIIPVYLEGFVKKYGSENFSFWQPSKTNQQSDQTL